MINKYKIGWKFLFGNDNIHNEAHYVASNILILLKIEFFCSVDGDQPSRWHGIRFGQGGGTEPENIKHKF